ncbi:winged helix-turn-helix transcriptional regulator [Mucilaginibacter auburnensis]|uniref:DNA-binding HxlR family transcriptional regulator n=1 Tax=Mucilaginibacter auburnensis TaxID=1457233 RepID=A0A2H9VVM0_9SPHI|nr:helix-turn-helix domain-containing protein [Mucilaginibacter auburnensis]PJJ84883.1 DNA-binding HxlR family transcriptional regulator [Mucilaginibacter auburnensis]
MVKEEKHLTAQECTKRLTAVGDALYAIGGKWKLRVIIALREGNSRFNEIQRAIDGISAKVLASELKDLELNGFIKRTVHTGTPVIVEYELTPYADTLNDVLTALFAWGAAHREHIKAGLR